MTSSSGSSGSIRAAVERAMAPGYGTCQRCRRPWKFVQSHTTDYTSNRGCFSLCETCWQDLGTPEARMPYYELLLHGWLDSAISEARDPGYAMKLVEETWPQIKAAVEAGR